MIIVLQQVNNETRDFKKEEEGLGKTKRFKKKLNSLRKKREGFF